MRFVIYFRDTYSVRDVGKYLDVLSNQFPGSKFIVMPAQENRIEVLECSFSLKSFVKVIAMKLKLRFR